MEYLSQLWSIYSSGLFIFADPATYYFAILGTVIGIIFGALPGLTSTMTLAVFTPLTFGLDSRIAFVFLIALYQASVYGGAISAVLVNIPGTPSAIATGLDGYPMAQRGEAGKAIGVATIVSVLGGYIGLAALMLFAPGLAEIVKRFGSWEYAVLAVLGLTLVSYVSEGSLVRGFIAGTLGMLIASVGQDPITAYPRLSFGRADLLGGFDMVVVMIGFFGVAEVFVQLEQGMKVEIVQKISGVLESFKEAAKHVGLIIRSSLIGVFVGVVPAAGGSIASITAYGVAKRTHRESDKFGKGYSGGIAAAESANNASVGGACITMMTMGIPGDPMTAVLIGALMLHGLLPGPALFRDHPDVVSSIMLGMALDLFLMLVLGLLCMRLFAKALLIPKHILMPIILVLCVVGSYALRNSIFDVGSAIIFGIIGFLLRKVNISPAPLILGVVLGPMFEENLRRSIALANGSLLPFVTRPVSLVLMVLSILIVISPYIKLRSASRGRGAAA